MRKSVHDKASDRCRAVACGLLAQDNKYDYGVYWPVVCAARTTALCVMLLRTRIIASEAGLIHMSFLGALFGVGVVGFLLDVNFLQPRQHCAK